MKTKITAIDLLPYAWLLFLIGVCISPRFKELNNIFYLTFLPLTLVALRQHYAEFIRTPVIIWLLALSGWMALSSTWASDPDYSDLKAIGYVVIFITGCSFIDETNVIAKWGGLIPIAIGIQLYFSTIPGQRLLGFGPMENPLYAGQFYLFFTWFFLHYKQFHPKPTTSNLIRIFGFAISIGACTLTQSRSVIFCIPLLLLMFLLQQDSIKNKKKAILILATLLTSSLIFLFFNNKWIILPSNTIDYQINLDKGETVLVKYLGTTGPSAFPRVEIPQGKLMPLQQSSNYKTFLFTAERADSYLFKIKFDMKTANPWKFVKLYTRKPKKSFQLKEEFIPPRVLQFEFSFGHRTEIWPIRLRQCLEKPIFGHGFTQSLPIPFHGSYVNDSHNFFLGTFFHGGVTALIIYVGLLVTCLYILCKKRRWGFAILLLCGIIMTLFDDEKFFSSTRPYWLLLLFPIGKALNASLNQKWAFLPKGLSSIN